MKSYCTQNNGDCTTCSLVNYGMDCTNNPVPEFFNPRKGNKESRAMAAYDGFKGGQTVAHIKKLIGKELAGRLTGHELGLVMSAVNRAYHEGKASMGAETVDGDYVWVNCLDKGFDLNVLRRLQKTETHTSNKVSFDGNLCSNYDYINDSYPGEKRKAYDVSTLPHETWKDWYYMNYETTTTWSLK